MARITPIDYLKLIKIFQREGWEYVGTKGDHIQMKKPGHKRRVVIPKYKEIPVFIIKNNLEVGGITREKYFELLELI